MGAEERIRAAGRPEVDYVFLSSLLNDYARPRQEISRLLQKGVLVRVKKGLYVVGGESAPAYSTHVLANLVYGPSYVSLDSALRYHNLIPERVEAVTSVTCNRDKSFTTPVGAFSYRYLRPAYYPLGVTQEEGEGGRHFLIATPEKALVDKLWFLRHEVEPEALEALLFDDLRIEPENLEKFNTRRLASIVQHYSDPVFGVLLSLVKAKRGES